MIFFVVRNLKHNMMIKKLKYNNIHHVKALRIRPLINSRGNGIMMSINTLTQNKNFYNLLRKSQLITTLNKRLLNISIKTPEIGARKLKQGLIS